ncbi:conserved hypothetical protein [Sporisorium reilianum SRZ2]|uniref:RED-like N-terminal domain-containing protein n=1 Tax=Sporisorium reilianum (strain SRZ2) TaxID=999809 RepID=E7A0Q1_SPORE|nr:conserved hypothetical protein [Sporisorium reilianum SRZ2]
MDQDAFRQLVSSSSAVGAPSTRAFGKAHKRHPAPSTASSSTKPSDLKPRKLHPTAPNSSSSYIDRASARRSGQPDTEFRDIEALHRDFEQRIAAAETDEERRTLRAQISSVGGDAKHSVLVKGLDWALLAQNKARIERESGASGEGEEGELESAFQQGRADKDAGGKRSREDIVEAIKRRREAKSTAEAAGTAGGFRPIGFKPIGGADKADEDAAEYKWVNGKRMRRKKKGSLVAEQSTASDGHRDQAVAADKGDSTLPNAEQTVPSLGAAHATNKKSASPSRDSPLQEQQGPQSVAQPETATQTILSSEQHRPPPPAPAPAEDDDDDDDEDIFADVGGWDGIPDANDDDAESDADTVHPAPVTPPPVAARSPTPPPPPPPRPAAPSPPHALTDTPLSQQPSTRPPNLIPHPSPPLTPPQTHQHHPQHPTQTPNPRDPSGPTTWTTPRKKRRRNTVDLFRYSCTHIPLPSHP